MSTRRKAIPVGVVRQLWAQSGGYCQSPSCNRALLVDVEGDVISIANMAHIIGCGASGPRSEEALAEHIEMNGYANLMMLCLVCHKAVDELEQTFTVEHLRSWKSQHEQQIRSLFQAPRFINERELLIYVNDLLEENAAVFKEYGPYSDKMMNGESGDALLLWRRRCLDTIVPNNRRILDVVEQNKRNFAYPWDVYQQLRTYRIHAEAFQDNCVLTQRVGDYKRFPLEFDRFVKNKLGLNVPESETRCAEELEYRTNQIHVFINRFLANHQFINQMEELNIATLQVGLEDGRSLRVFVTNTYYFTEYSFNKLMEMDPSVQAIICSCPAGSYSDSAKRLCIENGVGLFMLAEFMGAIRKTGEDFLNYLLRSDEEGRVGSLVNSLKDQKLPQGLNVYVFGSYLRRRVFDDIDIMIVYADLQARNAVERVQYALKSGWKVAGKAFDFTVCSDGEFAALRLMHDNLTRIFPVGHGAQKGVRSG